MVVAWACRCGRQSAWPLLSLPVALERSGGAAVLLARRLGQLVELGYQRGDSLASLVCASWDAAQGLGLVLNGGIGRPAPPASYDLKCPVGFWRVFGRDDAAQVVQHVAEFGEQPVGDAFGITRQVGFEGGGEQRALAVLCP